MARASGGATNMHPLRCRGGGGDRGTNGKNPTQPSEVKKTVKSRIESPNLRFVKKSNLCRTIFSAD